MLIAKSLSRPSSLERAMLAVARQHAGHGSSRHEKNAADLVGDDRTAQAIVAKADQTVGQTTVSGWASQVSNVDAVGEFLGSLAPLSAGAKLIGMGLSVTMQAGASSQSYPARNGTPGTTTPWVGEGEPISVLNVTLSGDAVLVPKKFGFIIPFTRELARRGNGEAVMRQLLREEAAAQLDGAMFSTTALSASEHPGMLAGLSAITGFAGGDEVAAETDMLALTDVVTAAGSGQVAFIVSPKRYGRLTILRRKWQALADLTFIPSLAVADTTIIGLDPASWVYGFGADGEIDVTTAALLHMSDDAQEIVSGSGPATADPVRSIWQTDGIVLRFLADVAFAPRRTNAAAFVVGATW